MMPNSRTHLAKLIGFIEQNIALSEYEMRQKGYYWDSVFIESTVECDYLYMVIKSVGFSKIVLNKDELIATQFRDVTIVFAVNVGQVIDI